MNSVEPASSVRMTRGPKTLPTLNCVSPKLLGRPRRGGAVFSHSGEESRMKKLALTAVLLSWAPSAKRTNYRKLFGLAGGIGRTLRRINRRSAGLALATLAPAAASPAPRQLGSVYRSRHNKVPKEQLCGSRRQLLDCNTRNFSNLSIAALNKSKRRRPRP